ncbi:hypothetical protein DUI87_04590 [Hirundo rustica rustica]|uniref:Uncharacterized protein n=1 Tax=Hirundo rustica rustica TaxID=333673 RepID=A0A3M0L483_HIRRU|nr:hypothetical protein DUI87_04590 [Hirundo rustica rustica]
MITSNPKHTCRLGVEWVEASPEEALGVLVNEKLNMTWQCDITSWKASQTLHGPCIQSSVASRLREGILPLYSTVVGSHVEHLSSSGLPAEEGHGLVGASPEEGYKNDQMAEVSFM